MENSDVEDGEKGAESHVRWHEGDEEAGVASTGSPLRRLPSNASAMSIRHIPSKRGSVDPSAALPIQ